MINCCMAYGINYADMVNMFIDPGTYFDRPGLFPTTPESSWTIIDNLNMLRPFKNGVMIAEPHRTRGYGANIKDGRRRACRSGYLPSICFIKALDVRLERYKL